MRRKKEKKAYQKIRISLPVQTGGFHATRKGGKYRRDLEKERLRKEIKSETD